MTREWTIAELIEELSKHPQDAKVRLEDADTLWTILKFTTSFNSADNEFWFHPSDYGEMKS